MKTKSTRKNNKKGISLIVLVITIIVMVILAGTIILTLNNSEIINKASSVVETTNKKQLRQDISTQLLLEGWYEGKSVTEDEFETYLNNVPEITNVIKLAEATWQVNREGTIVTVYKTGELVDEAIDVWDGVSVEVPEVKDGNIYLNKASQLNFLAKYVNGELTEAEKAGIEITDATVIHLMSDIDLGARQTNGILMSGTAWTPIGLTKDTKFTGTFDGNNHTIRGLYINTEETFAGLFGNSDTIKNLIIKDGYIKSSNKYVGAVVGALREGSIINCHNENTEVSGLSSVGGVLGQASTGSEAVSNCTNTGDVTGQQLDNGASQVGGIVGFGAASTISTCENFGKVTGTGKYVGGISGIVVYNANNCNNNNDVAGDGNNVGGIVGELGPSAQISNSTNTGNVIGGAQSVGGVVGLTGVSSKVINCNNRASIEGLKITGGIVGGAADAAQISACENYGNITVKEQSVGGIVGQLNPTAVVNNSINMGNIKSDGNYSGGIVGMILGIINKCYNTGAIEGIQCVGGIAGIEANNSTIQINSCYNTGSTKGTSEVAGILGAISGTGTTATVNNNYTIGAINASTTQNIGAIVGQLKGSYTITNNYYLQGIANVTMNDKGESKTESEMKTAVFVDLLNTGLEETTWELRQGINNGYPVIIGLK